MEKTGIILFDGVCNFCDASVNYAFRHDKKNYFRYAALQSDAGQQLMKTYNLDPKSLDTFILIENNKAYEKSTGALRVARHLSGPVKLLAFFLIFPAFTRNWVYTIIAQNRYRWFGKKDECMLPSKEMREKFLA